MSTNQDEQKTFVGFNAIADPDMIPQDAETSIRSVEISLNLDPKTADAISQILGDTLDNSTIASTANIATTAYQASLANHAPQASHANQAPQASHASQAPQASNLNQANIESMQTSTAHAFDDSYKE
jgi:hypothetical protein